MVDSFRGKYKGKSESELRKIASSSLFQKEAVVAAILELKDRNFDIEEFRNRLSEIQAELEVIKPESSVDKELVSKTIVFLVGLLLNPLIALIPYIINLIAVKRYYYIWETVAFIVLFSILNLFVLSLLNWHFGAVLFSNSLGTVILTEVLWNRHFHNWKGNKG